ncbi:hypothetical protein AC247_18140 [Salmonella enterica subsp. enterica serovar Ouakam]|nr:hypothetical protein AC247_18140 [Salmonella enterica subsp. enterica serovar Ouakam]
MKNLWMLLALSLFSGHALAEGTMGNGSGWCQPTNGTHTFPFSFNQTITDTDGNQTIMNLYLSKTPGSSGDNISPAVPPVAHVTMSGTITVPQSCSINAGQVIEVRLPDIEGKDIRNLGDSPQNSHVTTQVNFTCSNVADGTNLSMSLNGETDPHNPEYLKTDNENLGIRISDKYDKTIVPGGSAELPIEDYTDGKGSTEFTAAPVNTTGHVPHTGEYQATATLEIQIR